MKCFTIFFLFSILVVVVNAYTCDDLIVYTRKLDCKHEIRLWDVCPHHQRHFNYGVNDCKCLPTFLLYLENKEESDFECIEVHQGANGCITIDQIEKRLKTCISILSN